MTHHTWLTEKPDFTEECILITATWHSHPKNQHWEYTLYEIKWLEGVDEHEHTAWYWGICCSDGVEWGNISELGANKYFTMPLLK